MQKFFRGQRVKIADEMPRSMRHFEKGCEAIVVGSYTDQCMRTADSDHKFTLCLLDKNGKPFDRVSWYGEHQLTLLSDDRRAGEDLLQAFQSRC